MTKRNPKQEGTVLYDCVPQAGKCPIGCNQCFFNRDGAFYTEVPSVPSIDEVEDGIVRMNCGNDSNIQRDLVIKTAERYAHAFFNTSLLKLDFPGPVVLTANPKEEQPAGLIDEPPANLMFVRLRVSGTNLKHIDEAVQHYTERNVPVVLTFMSYYDRIPVVDEKELRMRADECYAWKVRHINSYYCPTIKFMDFVLRRYMQNRLVSMCGSLSVPYCKECRNCETHYWQTLKRMRGE